MDDELDAFAGGETHLEHAAGGVGAESMVRSSKAKTPMGLR